MRTKKMNRMLVFIVLVLMLAPLAVFAGGKKEEPAAPASEKEQEAKVTTETTQAKTSAQDTITIIDAAGREVTITKPVRKVIYNNPQPAAALRILGAWDKVVGGWTDLPSPELFPGLKELPNIVPSSTNIYDLNFEKVFELHPDVLLTLKWPVPAFDDMVDKLKPEIPVVVLVDANDPEAWVSSVTLLGIILDREEEAEDYIAWYKEIESSIKEKTAGMGEEEKPRVFIKTSGYSPEQLATLNKEMACINTLFEITGAVNIAADLPGQGGWIGDLDPEWLIEQNPDIVVESIWDAFYPGSVGYAIDDPSVARATRERIMNMDVFADGKAVKEGKVFLYHCDLATTYVFPAGMAYWAKWFHPELFKDLDPQAIHQEYLTRFMRIDYDLNEHGVFVCPEP